MRGRRDSQATMLAFVDLEERVPKDHPLRIIKAVADEALERLSAEFDGMYSKVGRASVPPERLLKASLLISLYSVRSERAFCEELEYNLLFRWFLDMNLMERSFDPTVFTKNRRRLLEHRIGQALFDEVVWEADRQSLLSDEHFSVDGTLIEAAASIKSFRRRDEERQPPDDDPGNPSVDFRGETLRNETHRSITDPEARLMRKGKGREARLVFMGHALMENGNGLLMDFVVSSATGTAERDAVPVLLDGARQRGFRPRTLGGDRCQWRRDLQPRGVDAQRLCPPKCQAKMSSGWIAMLADHDTADVARARDMGGLSASMYFFTVSLCMPSSRAIPRMDSPLRFALRTAFHLAV